MKSMLSSFNFIALAYSLIPLLLGIILHEVAHGYVAYLHGDKTAYMLGRLTLNPIPHIDPVGIGVFVLTALTSPFVFGWAKPVPVNPRYFKNPRKVMMLVSLAGPLTNMILAVAFATILSAIVHFVPPATIQGNKTVSFIFHMCYAGVFINFTLAWLNLLPIPPLDGSHILEGLLPQDLAIKYASLERYGFLILIVLLFTNILGKILSPLISTSVSLTFTILGL